MLDLTDEVGLATARRDFGRRLLLIQFQARLPPRSPRFRWPDPSTLLAVQPFIFDDLFSHGRTDAADPDWRHPGTSARSDARHWRPRFHPPSKKYERAFLKALTARLQDAVDLGSEALRKRGIEETEYPEVDADLLERYVELVAQVPGGGAGCASADGTTSSLPPECEYVTYLWPSAAQQDDRTCNSEPKRGSTGRSLSELLHGYASLTVREEGSAISKGTTGLKTWEACLRLACYLLAHPSPITEPGSRVIELGSGAGLLGTMCAVEQSLDARHSASSPSCPRTWLTDVPGQVLDRLKETLELNGLAHHSMAQIHALDWVELQKQLSKPADTATDEEEDADKDLDKFLRRVKPTLILAADVVYDPDLVGPLARTIRTALEAGADEGAKALVASTIRNPETYRSFRCALESQGLRGMVLPIEQRYLVSPDAHARPMPFFPSVHDPACDGTVELLEIRLGH